MILSPEDFARTKAALEPSDLPALARHVLDWEGQDDPALRALTEELGWRDPATGQLTERGQFVCDPMREYVFWLERDRRLPFADASIDLTADSFAGRSVFEIGSGSGMNLFSLADHAGSLTGLEPVGLYRQMSEIFAAHEGIAQFNTLAGAAEDLPVEDGSFDTVLCVTAHQYFDIQPALHQIARVLRPGGEAIIIGGTIGTFARGQFRAALSAPLRGGRAYAKTLVNTLGYMALRKRVLVKDSKWSTAHPVYPSRAAMRRMIEAAGLALSQPMQAVGPETCWRAVKPS